MKEILRYAALAVAAVSIFGLANIFSTQVRSFFYSASKPIQEVLWEKGRDLSFVSFSSRENELRSEIENLKIANGGLKADILRLKENREETETVREAVNTGLKAQFRITPARATAFFWEEDTLILNLGEKDGIKKGMAVVSAQKILYGFVGEVFYRSSRLTLLSERGTSLPVKIAGEDEESLSGLLKGGGGGKAFLELIPRERELKEGELILSAAVGNYPEGLLVGLADKLISGDTEPFQRAEVELFAKPRDFEYLFIILN